MLLFAFLAVVAAAGLAVFVGWLGTLPGVVAILALTALGLLLSRDALAQAEKVGRYRSGRNAELRVARELDPLQDRGWTVHHDVIKDRGGNIDHVAIGPTGAYVIETKLGAYLLKHLPQARRNAAWLGSRHRRWFTPVLCLATRGDEPRERDGVWIMGLPHLREWLESRGGRSSTRGDAKAARDDSRARSSRS
ncbi:MAG: nuclease-related domain-containing protein [Gaiellaceae bacterium]